jgi:hypothetical protein
MDGKFDTGTSLLHFYMVILLNKYSWNNSKAIFNSESNTKFVCSKRPCVTLNKPLGPGIRKLTFGSNLRTYTKANTMETYITSIKMACGS